jgi:hypothetical protein
LGPSSLKSWERFGSIENVDRFSIGGLVEEDAWVVGLVLEALEVVIERWLWMCSDTMKKSIEPYSSTKGILREEVCSRLTKPTTQVYLGNVGLLT